MATIYGGLRAPITLAVIEYLAVAGGGGGGGHSGGGGGGGGFLNSLSFPVVLGTTYVVTVGSGGAGGGGYSSTASGSSGSNSQISTNVQYSGYFDGSNDYLSLATTAAFGLGTGDFSIEFWANWTGILPALPLNGGGFIDLRSAVLAEATGIFLSTSGELQYYDGPANMVYGTSAFSTATWNHVALTRASGVWRLFLNGTQVTTHTSSSNLGTTRPILIGQSVNGTATSFNGYISNVRVIKGTAVYTSNFTPSATALTAITNTQLLTCQNNTFVDNSTNAFAISIGGDVAAKPAAPFTNLALKYSGYFDGVGDYVTAASNSAFSPGAGDFTVESWVSPAVLGVEQTIISKHNNQPGNGEWVLLINASNAPVFYFSTNGSNLLSVTGTTPIPQNAWSHIAVTRSGSTFKIYVNGVLNVTASNASAIFASSTELNIGRYLATAASISLFTGYISNVRFVKGTAVYTSNFAIPSEPLTVISGTSLLTLQNHAMVDNSVNNFTITKSGGVIPFEFSPVGNGLVTGGGGGGTRTPGIGARGLPGGSGGGGASESGLYYGGAGFANQGTFGGSGYDATTNSAGGGGGGASILGSAGASVTGGHGGAGKQWGISSTGNSIYFDGVGDYLSVTGNFAFGTGNWTVEFWVYPLAYGGTAAGGQLFGTVNGSTVGYSINLGESLNTFRIISNASGTWADNLSVGTGNGPVLNTWTHMAVVRNGANLTIYRNGSQVSTTSGAASWNFSGTTAIIGRFNESFNNRDFNGYLSNLRVINGTALYTTGFIPSTTPLTAITNTVLLTGQNTTVVDNSVNTFSLTSTGNTAVANIGPFIPAYLMSYSAYFDGSGDWLDLVYNSGFDVAGGTFTVECWINLSGLFTANTDGIRVGDIADFGPSTVGTGWEFLVNQTNSTISFSVQGVANNTMSCSASFTQGVWYHLAVVRNGSTNAIYINGVSQTLTTNNYSGASIGSGSLTIGTGRRFAGYVHDFLGYISNFRLVKGTAVYTANFTPSTTPLTVITNTQLLTCQNNTFVDNSTNAFVITTVGNTTSVTKTPFSSAYYYSGGGGGGASTTVGAGGLGGGGSGSINNVIAESGMANSGGGGGGSGFHTSGSRTGGNGGSGAVCVRWPVTYPAATATTGSPTVTIDGGYRIYKWTSSGSITI